MEERALAARQCVSFKAIPPPIWCRLPNDTVPATTMTLEQALALDYSPLFDARCYTCGRQGILHGEPRMRQHCWIYTSQRAQLSVIEIQKCHCRVYHRETIGPDLSSYGIFNWSNTTAFSHELLNDYTNIMQRSTMPLSAYAVSRSCHYQERHSPRPFVNRTTFSQAWFAYVNLQKITTQMRCLILQG